MLLSLQGSAERCLSACIIPAVVVVVVRVMTDTTLCADMKEPKKDIKADELLRNWMVR